MLTRIQTAMTRTVTGVATTVRTKARTRVVAVQMRQAIRKLMAEPFPIYGTVAQTANAKADGDANAYHRFSALAVRRACTFAAYTHLRYHTDVEQTYRAFMEAAEAAWMEHYMDRLHDLAQEKADKLAETLFR
jgi:hypothetical protein